MNEKQLSTIPKSRKKLMSLEQAHGLDYAITRNHQIQVGKRGRDYLKEFSTYVGSDGKASKSAIDRDSGEARASGGDIHVAVARQFNRLLGGSIKDADATGDIKLIFKHGLAWCEVEPQLKSGADCSAPRKKCFAQLWAKVEQIGAI